MNKKEEFNLIEERKKLFEEELIGEIASAGRIYRKIRQKDREFIKILKEASENNDWEVAIDDGKEDGFRIVSGHEFIDKLASSKLTKSQEELDYEQECEEGKI